MYFQILVDSYPYDESNQDTKSLQDFEEEKNNFAKQNQVQHFKLYAFLSS